MPIDWSAVRGSQDRSLASEIARRGAQESVSFKILEELANRRQQDEIERAATAREEIERERNRETAKLREAQQAETNRRNQETEADREAAQFMTAIGMLDPGSIITDPKMIEAANRRGLGSLFESDATTGQMKFKGTAAQNRALAREKQAEDNEKVARERLQEQIARNNDLMQNFTTLMTFNREREKRIADDADANRAIADRREQRLTNAKLKLGQMTPQQQIAFRTIMQTKMKERQGDILHSLTFGLIGEAGDDPLDVVEKAYSEVMGSSLLAPAPPSQPQGGVGSAPPAAPAVPAGRGNPPVPINAPQPQPAPTQPGQKITLPNGWVVTKRPKGIS